MAPARACIERPSPSSLQVQLSTPPSRAGHGLNHLSKAVGVPFIQRLSPALWAYGTEKAYKVLRVAVPELP